MEIGHYYKFHGSYEYGHTLVGQYAGIDEDSGFFIFNGILNWDTIRKHNDLTDVMKYASNIMVNPHFTNCFYPMKNYFEEL